MMVRNVNGIDFRFVYLERGDNLIFVSSLQLKSPRGRYEVTRGVFSRSSRDGLMSSSDRNALTRESFNAITWMQMDRSGRSMTFVWARYVDV
jgi:hypothetical protein